MRRHALSIGELRQELAGDSVMRRAMLAKLVALIRADERAKTLDALGRAKDAAATEPR